MKTQYIILSLLTFPVTCILSQEIPVQVQQQLETLVDGGQEETEDDAYWQQLEKFTRHPLNLNHVTGEDLRELHILSDWQIENFVRYRNLFGNLVNVHELQAVPSWHPALIRRLMPFITVATELTGIERIRQRFRLGTHTFLFRIAQIVETSKGLNRSSTGNRYQGSPQKIFTRYRYSYKNLLQFGWLGDKDAGESFFKGAQRYGFDFNSFHLFMRKIGAIEALALGDFTVNMGQGLIHWQSLAFKKSGETMFIKRQSPVLRPYNAGGEFNFHRGAGITLRKKKIELTTFISFRKLSANKETDTITQRTIISSIQPSGYHRTTAEILDRNVLSQLAAGASVRKKVSAGHLAANIIHYKYSIPLQKRDEPYNVYAIKGASWTNFSADYSYTFRNFHFFGEAAVDKNLHTALINGCLISADPQVDISFVYRRLQNEYQASNANAFTENAIPSNENGLYAGLSIRPATGWKLEAFADVYQFPWLKYLVDAPSYGNDLFMQLSYTPDKKLDMQARFARSTRLSNAPENDAVLNQLSPIQRTSWQVQMNYILTPSFTWRNRLQLLWLQAQENENGFSLYTDGLFKPQMKPYSFVARVQYFETTGYNSRLYAYENDVLYSHGIPAMFGRGYRYYLVMQIKPAKNISMSFRWATTVYTSQVSIGSGLDEIPGNQKTELKMQILYIIN